MTAQLSQRGVGRPARPRPDGRAWVLVALACAPALSVAPAAAQLGPQAYEHADLDVSSPRALAFSPNDRFLAVGTGRGTVEIFDVEAGRRVQSVRAAGAAIVGLEFTADGSALYAAAEDRRIVEVDLLAGSVSKTHATRARVRSFDLSPDGRALLWVGDDGAAEVLNERFARQAQLESPNFFRRSLRYGAFGVGGAEVFAAADEDGRTAYWSLGTPEPIRVGELVREEYTAFGQDHRGELLALGVKALSLRVGASTGGSLAASSSHSVRLVDWARGRVVREIPDLGSEVRALAVSPDRTIVMIATRDGLDGYSTQEARRTLSVQRGRAVRAVAFSPSGGWLAAALDGEGVSVFELSGTTVASRPVAVSGGDVLAQSAKFEFTTERAPLLTSFERFTLAVLDVDNLGVEPDLARTVSNLVVSRLANVPHVSLVERGAIEKVLGELKLQNTGVTSASDAAEIGRVLNAGRVLLGNVNRLGSSVTVAVRLVETESARVVGAREILCRSCQPEDLPQAMTLLVGALVAAP